MTNATSNDWQEANTRYLTARLALVGERVKSLCDIPGEGAGEQSAQEPGRIDSLERAAVTIASEMDSKPALDLLCEAFDLALFERDLLLLCAGAELHDEFSQLCAS